MKKFYLSLCLLLSVVSATFAQTIANAGMETWRTIVVFGFPPSFAHAPHQWYGDDSLLLALGPVVAPGDVFQANLHQDTFRHSGSYSAKVMSLNQDSTFGIIPGMLSNAKPEIGGTGGSGSILDLLAFTGGTPTTLRIQSVSAWVAYFPGIDSVTHTTGNDTGLMMVQAVTLMPGFDSVIGIAIMPIPPSDTDTFVQITANINYNPADTALFTTDLVRIIFLSGGGAMTILDSSTLYVDDVSMVGNPQSPPPPPVDHTAVGNTAKNNNAVAVYPNPANNTLFFDAKTNSPLRCRIMAADGRVVATKIFTGSASMDVSHVAAGSYFYFLTDEKNAVIQQGKVNVTH